MTLIENDDQSGTYESSERRLTAEFWLIGHPTAPTL